jgi:hypothetical protein
MIIMASASGTLVPAIVRLVAADEDTVRDVIHAFNAKGLAALNPRWAGGRPRLISDGDIEVIVTAAATGRRSRASRSRGESAQAGRPFSLLSPAGGHRAGAAAADPARPRHQLPADQDLEGIHRPGQRRQAGPDRVHHQSLPGPCFASGQFGPLSVRPCQGACWVPRNARPGCATYHRSQGVRYFDGCYGIGDDSCGA